MKTLDTIFSTAWLYERYASWFESQIIIEILFPNFIKVVSFGISSWKRKEGKAVPITLARVTALTLP
jgi:hypothetical protein